MSASGTEADMEPGAESFSRRSLLPLAQVFARFLQISADRVVRDRKPYQSKIANDLGYDRRELVVRVV
ncbi:MAG: hypothetical protein BGP05_10015 [Rhizobiales bacterium 62-47]|nr:MAG: hypothetical protein BGP05_10015 [Rhizobiales bacterium 62-47]